MCCWVRMMFVFTLLSTIGVTGDGNVIIQENNQSNRENSGVCGEHATWVFDERTSTLTISGYGAMEDYTSPEDFPWDSIRSNIDTIVIEEGITTIGDRSFIQCTNMISVSIPSSVTSIGSYAFSNCTILPSVIIPLGVTLIKDNAFYKCISLSEVTIPPSVEMIGFCAFQECTTLSSVAILSKNISIEENAFSDCNLSKIVFLGPIVSCSTWGIPIWILFILPDLSSMINCGPGGEICYDSPDEIIAKHNMCFEIDGCQSQTMISFRKRESAIEWENRTTEGCVKYICDNETGNNAIFQCSDKETCIDNVCVPKEDTDSLFTVEIDVNNMSVSMLNATELSETISIMTGIDTNEMKIGTNVNEKGQVFQIRVYVNEKEKANKIAFFINNCI